MAKDRTSPTDKAATAETLDLIHGQLETLNQTLEDLQVDIQWALRNIVHHLADHSPPARRDEPLQRAGESPLHLLRELLTEPELDQSDVSEPTRQTVSKILERLSPHPTSHACNPHDDSSPTGQEKMSNENTEFESDDMLF